MSTPIMLHDLDKLFQSTVSEPQLHLDRCLEQDEHGLWWPGENGASPHDSILQPIRKYPVEMTGSYHHQQHQHAPPHVPALSPTAAQLHHQHHQQQQQHHHHHSILKSNEHFTQMVSDYSLRAGDELNNREMNYLQNVFAQDNFVLDLQTPLYTLPQLHRPGLHKNGFDTIAATAAGGNATTSTVYGSEEETECLTSPGSSPELKPQDHPIKSKCMTFVSATGKVKMICEVQGCSKVAQSRKRCKRHGGGPRCRYPGCTKSSQGKGRCRTHGGGKQCSVDGCTSGAQQRGFCSRHGGAKLCSVDGCERHSRGNGMCAFHGGGKRCSVVDCNRSSRIQGMCAMHKRLTDNGTHLEHKLSAAAQ